MNLFIPLPDSEHSAEVPIEKQSMATDASTHDAREKAGSALAEIELAEVNFAPLPETEISAEILIEKYSKGKATSVCFRSYLESVLAILEGRKELSILHRLEEHLRRQIAISGSNRWATFSTLLNLLQWVLALKASLTGNKGEAKDQTTSYPLNPLCPQARAPPPQQWCSGTASV